MKEIASGGETILVLDRGEELLSSLNNYAKERDLSSVWLSGLGAAEKMTIGYYDLATRSYVWTEIDQGIVEILNLTGNLTFFEGEPLWHIHGVFSGTDLKAFGGHVKEMYVGLTCELRLTAVDAKIERRYHNETGLNLII